MDRAAVYGAACRTFESCQGDMETEDTCGQKQYRTVPHATFKAAMAMLGIDVETLNGVSIGNWNDDDELMFPFTRVMKKNGSFWRIKFSTDLEPMGTLVSYVGIEHPEPLNPCCARHRVNLPAPCSTAKFDGCEPCCDNCQTYE